MGSEMCIRDRVLTFAISILLLLSGSFEAQPDGSPYQLFLHREGDSNTVTLTCNRMNDSDSNAIKYFLNGMELESYSLLKPIPSSGSQSVTFVIDRMHEGNYSCIMCIAPFT